MAYQTLYREWRPARFSEVSGQDHIKHTLSNMLQRSRVPHALLFTGPRGTGKTTMAKIMARALNCHRGVTAEPCLVCPACVAIAEGSSLDVVEIDAASNRGIDEIRELREHVKFAPVDLRTKVYIIDEVHMLTTEAFNALLKTLEEPPQHVVFVLATTEPHKLPATIISRCQRFDFRRLAAQAIIARLMQVAAANGVSVSTSAAHEIAQHAVGSMRDALGLFEQCAAFVDGKIDVDAVLAVTGTVPSAVYVKLLTALEEGNLALCMQQLHSELTGGRETGQYLVSYIAVLRQLLLSVHSPRVFADIGYEGEQRESFLCLGQKLMPHLPAIIDIALQTENDMRYGGHPRLHLELMLVKQANAMQALPRAAGVAVLAETDEPTPGSQAKLAPPTADTPRADAPRAEVPRSEIPRVDARKAEISQLVKAWPEVQRLVKQKAPLTGATMGAISPLRLEGDTVILQMNESNVHTFNRLSKPADLLHIAKAFSQVLGKSVEVKLIMPDGSGSAVSAPSASENRVQQVIEIFEGTIVKTKE
ncbi:MAG: DNA polymerase III subunit tau [Firmicutes bacterium]|nr:DNA polymerase III subunit tau [Bacillota bacterium]